MSADRFEFKINYDKDGTKTDLKVGLSLSESKALVVLLESMISIAENSSNKIGDYIIKVEKGSVAVAVESPDLSYLGDEIHNILNNTSKETEIVQAFRNVQNLFNKNGLTYSSSLVSKNSVYSDLYSEIVSAKAFRTKNIRRNKEIEITFLKGYLHEVGGTNPNFHISYNGSMNKIECNKEEAQRVKDHLYKMVYLAVLETKYSSGKSKFRFIDSYKTVEDFNYHKALLDDTYKLDKLDVLRKINNDLKNYLKQNDLLKVRALLKLYNFDIIDNSILKTILIMTKSFADRSEIKELRLSIKGILEKKRGSKLV